MQDGTYTSEGALRSAFRRQKTLNTRYGLSHGQHKSLVALSNWRGLPEHVILSITHGRLCFDFNAIPPHSFPILGLRVVMLD